MCKAAEHRLPFRYRHRCHRHWWHVHYHRGLAVLSFLGVKQHFCCDELVGSLGACCVAISLSRMQFWFRIPPAWGVLCKGARRAELESLAASLHHSSAGFKSRVLACMRACRGGIRWCSFSCPFSGKGCVLGGVAAHFLTQSSSKN